MQHLRAIGEDEMVAVFLQTEVASTRFAPTILAILRRDGRERRIIDHPDLSNAADNAYRRHVLGEYRGYGRDADVFKDFPADVRWYRASATKVDVARVRYINDDYWTAPSGGSRLATDAVARIRQGIDVFGVSNSGFWYVNNRQSKQTACASPDDAGGHDRPVDDGPPAADMPLLARSFAATLRAPLRSALVR
jgi:hypothetical protein